METDKTNLKSNKRWQVWVDTGGTFTDCIAFSPEGEMRRAKVLSNSSLRGEITSVISDCRYRITQEWNAPVNFVKGFRFRMLGGSEEAEVLEFDPVENLIVTDRNVLPKNFSGKISFEVLADMEAPVLAARLVTATAPEKKLPPINMRLATTKATNALLERKISRTALFITKGFGDFPLIGTQQRPDLFSLKIDKPKPLFEEVVEVSERLNKNGEVISAPEFSEIEHRIEELVSKGIDSAAVVLMHSYISDKHELELKQLLMEKGFRHVSVSSELASMIGFLPRLQTTVTNAVLAPVIDAYLNSVEKELKNGSLYVMNSAGGLTPGNRYTPKDSLLSGPAGGVVGAAAIAENHGFTKAVSFDMGGTSTDVARYNEAHEMVFEHSVGDARLMAPALKIETVAAGGGSVCYFDGFTLRVGPESAGAFPGPACYGAGGPLTITDVNLLAGRLDPMGFHIPVKKEKAEEKLHEICDEIQAKTGEKTTREDVLSGFLAIANERMADAVKRISVRQGYDTKEYALVSFGGAGGQHACAIAGLLQCKTVLVSEWAGLLSAYGLGCSHIEEYAAIQVLRPFEEIEFDLDDIVDDLTDQARKKLEKSNPQFGGDIRTRKIISMRFQGQHHAVDMDFEDTDTLFSDFSDVYQQRFGHWIEDKEVEVVSIRVIVSAGKHEQGMGEDVLSGKTERIPKRKQKAWFNGQYHEIDIFTRGELQSGGKLAGPCMVADPYSTLVVEPGWEGEVKSDGTIILTQKESAEIAGKTPESEAAMLELYTNRLTSIATEMGEMLQRTAISVNVKDRLDFSCALLSKDGDLVVNAPHIPVHLGAMGLCVRSLMQHIEMKPGDVVVTNHPAYGGSHLPDITVVTPIYDKDNETLLGFAASRAHHAESGGKTPGSMPPDAKNLAEEGVVIPPMHMIRRGVVYRDEIQKRLTKAPYPVRNIGENMADLWAAVAANQRGAEPLRELSLKSGRDTLQHYMDALKKLAAEKTRALIKKIENGTYTSRELLDDSTVLQAKIEISDEAMSIDFSGTSDVHPGNLNATPAIVNSVIMYVLRVLINEELPLNDGLLEPVEIKLPKCLLNPDFGDDPWGCPAVAGGNTEVSQRLTDLLLKPFGKVACSQGTMNNVLFGNQRFGYYETIGGGTGAGPDFHGVDATHHHMTNTKGTDPEIFEFYYPVMLEKYAIRKDSGGKGIFNGGNGIIRKIRFLEDVEITVISQHRVVPPYGINGGSPGKPGTQYIIRQNGDKKPLKNADAANMKSGDLFVIETPGGGGGS